MNLETRNVLENFDKSFGPNNTVTYRHVSEGENGSIKIEFDFVNVDSGDIARHFMLAEFTKQNPFSPQYKLSLTCKYKFVPARKRTFTIDGYKFTINHAERTVVCDCGYFSFTSMAMKRVLKTFFKSNYTEPFIIYAPEKPICKPNEEALNFTIKKMKNDIPEEINPYEPFVSDVLPFDVTEADRHAEEEFRRRFEKPYVDREELTNTRKSSANRNDYRSDFHGDSSRERSRVMIAAIIGKTLKQHVFGQDTYIEQLALHIQEHLRLGKTSAMLVIGPSGSGKTYTVKSLFEYCKNVLPDDYVLIYEDVSGLTEKGFTGGEVSDIFKSINRRNIKRGLIFIDEVDKIMVPSSNASGENVNAPIQTELMNYISGKEYKDIDTSKFFFVLGGAFPGLFAKHKAIKRSIGFEKAETHIDVAEMGKESSHDLELVPLKSESGKEMFTVSYNDHSGESVQLRDDLVEFGAVPEFVGRLGTIVTLNKLSDEVYRTILESVVIPNRTKDVEDVYDVQFVFDDSAKDAIIKSAVNNKYGGRIISASVDDLVNAILYKVLDVVSERFMHSNVRITVTYEGGKYRYILSCENRLGA